MGLNLGNFHEGYVKLPEGARLSWPWWLRSPKATSDFCWQASGGHPLVIEPRRSRILTTMYIYVLYTL